MELLTAAHAGGERTCSINCPVRMDGSRLIGTCSPGFVPLSLLGFLGDLVEILTGQGGTGMLAGR
eukprot:scaffold664238_cov46-Prasinocladus_malaysianus.AAC.1